MEAPVIASKSTSELLRHDFSEQIIHAVRQLKTPATCWLMGPVGSPAHSSAASLRIDFSRKGIWYKFYDQYALEPGHQLLTPVEDVSNLAGRLARVENFSTYLAAKDDCDLRCMLQNNQLNIYLGQQGQWVPDVNFCLSPECEQQLASCLLEIHRANMKASVDTAPVFGLT